MSIAVLHFGLFLCLKSPPFFPGMNPWLEFAPRLFHLPRVTRNPMSFICHPRSPVASMVLKSQSSAPHHHWYICRVRLFPTHGLESADPFWPATRPDAFSFHFTIFQRILNRNQAAGIASLGKLMSARPWPAGRMIIVLSASDEENLALPHRGATPAFSLFSLFKLLRD